MNEDVVEEISRQLARIANYLGDSICRKTMCHEDVEEWGGWTQWREVPAGKSRSRWGPCPRCGEFQSELEVERSK